VKTPAERGPIGAWAYTARTAAELTVEDVADRLRDRGHAVHPATIRGIEGGTKKPGRALLTGLSDLYGVHPPADEKPDVLDQDSIVAALDRQTALLERLVLALTPGTRGPTLETPALLREQQAAADEAGRQRQHEPTRPISDRLNATGEP
jgi:transcriptional regulator with XRE-family HTH domain